MIDPHSFDMIMQEMEHLHGDIYQIGYFVLGVIGLVIIIISNRGIKK